jgi:hypothetical protein
MREKSFIRLTPGVSDLLPLVPIFEGNGTFNVLAENYKIL